MTKIDNNKLYLFLAKQENWKADADTNNDDTLTLAEFRTYLKDFWQDGSITNDVINRFWSSFDTNTSAKFRDKIETILRQKLNGKTGSLYIDSSSFRFSGKSFYVWSRIIFIF